MLNNILLFLYLFSASIFASGDDSKVVDSQFVVNKGEKLEYKVSFGFLTVGEATMKVREKTYRVQDAGCYKVDIFGKTSGAVGWVTRVNDHWGAYIDKESYQPYISYRNIEEGRYRKNELVRFYHESGKVEAKEVNQKTGEYKEPTIYDARGKQLFDMIGGYMHLRSIDFDSYEIGDTIKVDAFFEDTIYDFRIIYQGKDVVKTKVGSVRAFKLVPIMPDNKLFDGENAIATWFSDDQNKIPLKVKADMFVGSVTVDLVDHQNLTSPLALVED
ncbi:DUF3108 domain-containing protein [Roseivirga sp. BDSF3-8]|uniref:DUF3108 domain-containing protein n=1 Tax=Roseivirga sp. BDSF3-8 TaxID=3241598 RepID=UPI003531EF62